MVPPAEQDAGYAGLADAWLDLQGLQPTGATRARSRAFLAAAEEAAPPGRAAPAPAPRLSRRAVLAATEPSVLTPSQACCDALVAATCQPLADAPPHASHQPPATGHQRPAICHLALIGTCHSPLADAPPLASHQPPATYHSPLTTHHLPLTTCRAITGILVGDVRCRAGHAQGRRPGAAAGALALTLTPTPTLALALALA